MTHEPAQGQERVLLVEAKKYHLARDASEVGYVGRTRFICWAIEIAVGDHGTYAAIAAGRALKDLILERLEGHARLEGWLEKNHGISPHHFPAAEYRNRVQVARHAWIDSLIEEFS